MSGLHALTVNTEPTAEPHIYAEDDAAIYQSMFGGDGVCSIGQNCAATVISNNKVRVADGVLCVGGHMARVRYGEYQDCEIMNGQTGYNRNDIIVAKFVTTGTQGTDTYTLEVVQGSAVTGTATDPVLTQGNLYVGEKIRMMPLYRVKIEGLSIVAVEQLFELIPTIPELQAQVTELNGNFRNVLIKTLSADDIARGEVSSLNGQVIRQGKKIIIDCEFTLDSMLGGSIWLINQHTFPLHSSCYTTKPAFTINKNSISDDAHYVGVGEIQNGGIVVRVRRPGTYVFHSEYVID